MLVFHNENTSSIYLFHTSGFYSSKYFLLYCGHKNICKGCGHFRSHGNLRSGPPLTLRSPEVACVQTSCILAAQEFVGNLALQGNGLLSIIRLSISIKYLVGIMRRSIRSLTIPPRKPPVIWGKAFPGGGEFEPCLGGVGNLNRKCQIFLAEYTWLFQYGAV